LAFDPPKDSIWNFNVTYMVGKEPLEVEADVCCDGGVDSDGRIYVYHR
jgi:hypothetical protein